MRKSVVSRMKMESCAACPYTKEADIVKHDTQPALLTVIKLKFFSSWEILWFVGVFALIVMVGVGGLLYWRRSNVVPTPLK